MSLGGRCGCGLRRQQPYELGIEDNYETTPLSPTPLAATPLPSWRHPESVPLQQASAELTRWQPAEDLSRSPMVTRPPYTPAPERWPPTYALNLAAVGAVLGIILLVGFLVGTRQHGTGLVGIWGRDNGASLGELVLEDLFDGSNLDRSLWQVEVNCWGGGNQERQCYRDNPANLWLSDGRLHLRAIRGEYSGSLEGCTNNAQGSCNWPQPFTSARLRTLGSPRGSWRYGRVEVRAKLPKGNYLWPAIWMLPIDARYGNWAASGEIDIMEYRGQQPDAVNHAIHFWSSWPDDKVVGTLHKVSGVSDFSAGFHDFAVDWIADPVSRRPLKLSWLVDGVEYYAVDLRNNFFPEGSGHPAGAPWDQRFYLILNVAVGGSFFKGGGYSLLSTTPAECDAAAATWLDPTMEIEHVRVWAQKGFENYDS